MKGMGLFSTVFVLLLILKLCGFITISWVWVFFPLMLSVLIGVIVLFIVMSVALMAWLCGGDIKINRRG